ncbi:cobalamin trafficking protein CblD isoform X1 [Homalodisca vitripennis]|nr:cobalamin trafficking protein CblD isoform X1 [Homalodisca vitripennis]
MIKKLRMLNYRGAFLSKKINWQTYNSVTSFALYSRKSNTNQGDGFKIVERKGAESRDEVTNSSLGLNANWELLTPQGFRFFLPGNTGPAWQDVHSSANISSQGHLEDGSPLDCTVRECPILLRQGVYELFPGTEGLGSLTIVTLAQHARARVTGDLETERLTKQFVLAAQDICSKLKLAGFWADFINPFSGLPYISAGAQQSGRLYQTDERFRCLGFHIFEKNQCKVIADRSSRRFLGSLFTNAPPSTILLKKILQQYED